MKLQPLGDRVVVERVSAEEKTAGGIVLPDTAKEKPRRGKVIAVGTGRRLRDGTIADVAPTILDLAGLPGWPGITGRSLLAG